MTLRVTMQLSLDFKFDVIMKLFKHNIIYESQQVEEENDISVQLKMRPPASKAFICFETALRWMEQ